MAPTLFPTEPCNRRKFVVTAGLVVAGGIVACSRKEVRSAQDNPAKETPPSPDRETHEVPLLPTEPIIIRVRVGRVRDTGNAIVGQTNIQRTGDTWIAEGNPTGFTTNEHTIIFHTASDRTIRVDNQTKIVTGHVVVYPRNDLSLHAFDVVAHIPLETYLPGVLAGELYPHWHPTTYASQAVAARSYAVAEHLQRIHTSHYDVTDGPSSQMFVGNVMLDVAHQGVNETRGVVLMWKNTIIPAYYSACCGGIPATASDEISGAKQHEIPPLQGHDGEDACTTLDIHKWSVQRHSRTLRRRLNACAISMKTPSFGDIHSIRRIESSRTNRHGRPTEIAIVDRRDNVFHVRTREFIRAVNARIASLPGPSPTIWSSFLIGNRRGSNIQLSGVGIGHGVGMCQYGAQELSKMGQTWQDILSWYYPNADMTTLSGS